MNTYGWRMRKNVKDMYKLVDADLPDFDWANDKEFLDKLDTRTSDYKSGEVAGIPWENAREKILA